MKDETKAKIAELLSGEEPDDRRRAAEELSNQHGLAVIAALAAALNDENKGVRDAACHALLVMGGANVARAIVEYIADDNIVTRNLAGELLHQLGKDAVPALLPYVQDSNFDVRKFAVDLLGLVGSEGVAHHIVPLLDDSDENVIAASIEALGNLRNPEVVPHLLQAYKKHAFAQAPVAEALGKLGGIQASDFLLLTFNKNVSEESPDPVVLFTIIESLGVIGDEHALVVLQNRVQNVRGRLRNIVLHAIVRIAERVHGKVDLPLSLTRDLLGALKDDDPKIKASAAKGLASTVDSEVTQALLRSFGVEESLDELLYSLLELRDDVMPSVVDALSEHRMKFPRHGIKLVGRLANRLIQQILRHEPFHCEEGVLTHAFEVVAAEWAEADEETRAAIVDTLFHLDGDRSVGFLDTIMEDPDPWLRVHVIEQLAAIGDRRVPMFVNRFLRDEDEMVREVAMSILQSRSEAMGNGALVV